ncbi:hypothetical protein C1646_761837 [Rhizophagus diaphanus]|nr:hypothetical protein C1646_761837 [Rhizophagus diaphanus] [Rhizophagus sp. MUCL 43196]
MFINSNSDNIDNTDNFTVNDKLVENDNTVIIVRKLKEAAKKYHQEHASHEIHTKRSTNEIDKTLADVDDDVSDDVNDNDDKQNNEIEDCNWNNKIQAAFENLEIDIKKENKKMKFSEIISNAAGKEVYHARCFHSWDISSQMLMIQMILLGFGFAPSSTIYINTVRNYLKEFEYTYAKVKKGVYINGYKKKDVVAYRKIFLEQMNEFEHRMSIFSEDNLEEIT